MVQLHPVQYDSHQTNMDLVLQRQYDAGNAHSTNLLCVSEKKREKMRLMKLQDAISAWTLLTAWIHSSNRLEQRNPSCMATDHRPNPLFSAF